VESRVKSIISNRYLSVHPLGETQKWSKALVLLPQTAILSIQLPNLELLEKIGRIRPYFRQIATDYQKKNTSRFFRIEFSFYGIIYLVR
jgi:hypothetical protein